MPGKVVFDERRCKGCELCVLVCPRKIITMKETRNERGYRPATVVDMDKCTACAICAQMCPDAVIEVFRLPAARAAETGEAGTERRGT